MKLGDYYIDDYYEPDTVVLKVSDIIEVNRHKCTVVYSSDPDRMSIGEIVVRTSDDEELIPVAMITIDNKVILINL
jgi:hypothetical protein